MPSSLLPLSLKENGIILHWRKMKMGPEYLNAFTVGDQLLGGADEPLRWMLSARSLAERLQEHSLGRT